MFLVKRRQFLQFAGSALAMLGVKQLDVVRQGDSYGKVLAQSTSRKLALLVGINDYPKSERLSNLQGCITDVGLQRELLIYRFGFNPKDILSLTDAAASRQGILTAFDEHLIKQAKPGDVVVFHFSGHGSQVPDPNPISADKLNSTFVPADDAGAQDGVVQDIMGRSLFLLMYALKTENFTAVLDSCHSGGGTRGNIRVRSARGGSEYKYSPAEIEYQNQLLSKLNLPRQEFEKLRSLGVAKGVVIASAQREQQAADAAFDDFYAGAFTYTLTQYLWQQTSSQTVGSAIATVGRSTTQMSSTSQNPLLEAKPKSGNEQKPIYFTSIQTPPAEAVITQVRGNRAKVWLGGLSPESLAAFNTGAKFALVNASGRGDKQVELTSRTGLEGEVSLSETVQPGTLLQEANRVIPADLKLRIGLDPSLDGDADNALQALKGINRIEPVPAKLGNVPYAGEVQYIFGRFTEKLRQEVSQQKQNQQLPMVGTLGLFSPALELIPGSFGENKNETVSNAVQRLNAKLKSLLAARMLKTTLNMNSSRLNLEVSMSEEGNQTPQLIATAFNARGLKKSPTAKPPQPIRTNLQQLPVDTPIQFSITNKESVPLHISVLVIDPTGEMTVVFPNKWAALDDATRVEPNQQLLIPNREDDFSLKISEPKGFAEVLVIASRSPLAKALEKLQAVAPPNQRSGPVLPSKPDEVVTNLLDDLDGNRGGSGGSQIMDTTQMSTMSITFEVV